jgi:hypothetical protein
MVKLFSITYYETLGDTDFVFQTTSDGEITLSRKNNGDIFVEIKDFVTIEEMQDVLDMIKDRKLTIEL